MSPKSDISETPRIIDIEANFSTCELVKPDKLRDSKIQL